MGKRYLVGSMLINIGIIGSFMLSGYYIEKEIDFLIFYCLGGCFLLLNTLWEKSDIFNEEKGE